MSRDRAKDFAPIADDYAFFEQHSSEALNGAVAHSQALHDRLPAHGPLRMLDFGCGSGTFSERLLELIGWPPERLRLSLVEPVEAARRQAVSRLARFTSGRPAHSASLPARTEAAYEVVLANHVLYFVPSLPATLASLIAARASGGVFLAAIAGRSNFLIELWSLAFELLDRPMPYHTSEDVAAALDDLGVGYTRQAVPYELAFTDSPENRAHIIRFLLADQLAVLPREPLLAQFDRHRAGDMITVRTSADHYVVPATGAG